MRYRGNVFRMRDYSGVFGAAPIIPVMTQPVAGFYYQVVKGDTPWAVSKSAYVDLGLAPVKTGLMLLNDNPANAHIQKKTTGWESYGVKGLQFTQHYAAGDADAVYGSGSAYPLLWIPPIDGRTPDQMGGAQGPAGPTGPTGESGKMGPAGPQGERGPIGPAGPQGERGPIGPAGPQGERGPIGLPGSADPEAIKKLIKDYAGGVIDSQLAEYLRTHPVEQGARGPAGPQGERGPTGAQGERGPAGPQGERGPAGSGADFDMEDALSKVRDVCDARIRIALRDLKTDTGTQVKTAGISSESGLLFAAVAAGIVGTAIFMSAKTKRSKPKGMVSP